MHLRRFFRIGSAVHALALTGDGHVWVGSECDLRLLDSSGHVHFRLGGVHAVRPFNAVGCTSTGGAFAVERLGRLYRLSPLATNDALVEVAAPIAWTPDQIWTDCNDLYSLAIATPLAGADGGAASVLALGHVGPAITVLDASGQLRWRYHLENGRSTGVRTWSVGFSADAAMLYAGSLAPVRSAHTEAFLLAAFEVETGRVCAARIFTEPVSLLVPLAPPLGVAAVHIRRERCRVVGYTANLGEVAWQITCAPGEIVTALTADTASDLLVAGTNTGRLWLVDGQTGQRLATCDLLYYSTVLSIAAWGLGGKALHIAADRAAAPTKASAPLRAAAPGRHAAPQPAIHGAIVAGMANGHAAYLELRKVNLNHERERTESAAC